MNPKIIHAGALIFAAASGILASADRIAPLAAISPELAHLWPFALAVSVAIVNIGKLFQPADTAPVSAPVTPLPASILSK